MNSHKRVLIIEDEQNLRESIADFLRLQGLVVLEASNGLEGIDAVKQLRPTHIVCDILMDKMDGFEIVKIVKNNVETGKIPFIMISALNDEATKLKTIELGADFFLCKPFLMNDLLQLLT